MNDRGRDDRPADGSGAKLTRTASMDVLPQTPQPDVVGEVSLEPCQVDKRARRQFDAGGVAARVDSGHLV